MASSCLLGAGRGGGGVPDRKIVAVFITGRP